MDKPEFQHSEAFLQWIWENLLFDFTDLKTTCGKSLNIIRQGVLNTTDGPDFTHAALEVDNLIWHGDIEMHVTSNGWNAHDHQNDPNFNTVILHVVTDGSPQPVITQNGSTPYTLNLMPYMSKKLRVFLKGFEDPAALPCSRGVSFISEEAFFKQIEKSHIEYFEKKSNDFLRFYDPDKLPSDAWKYALILSLWDGFGIAHNREPMQETAQQLLEKWSGASVGQGTELAFNIAGIYDDGNDLKWNMKSVRPANHPKQRITEAVKFTALILREPFKNLLSSRSTEIWKTWVEEAGLHRSSRIEILYGTVYLPSIYVLGNLFAHQKLSQHVLSEWKRLKTPIPASLLKRFKSLNLNSSTYRKKLGAIHQLKSYCDDHRCSECFVLKNAIES
ncbi:DUF2851 family protein [Gracilimonas halophila]|uniref:DUF2851 family protein n=1 Tax=Gracilimonas halophila TaxID=1834464 RepID=A0ABW5JGN8_9BACT